MVRLFCFGYGYVARHLAEALRGHGIHTAGTSRDAEKAASINGHVFADDTPLDAAGLSALHDATHVLVSLPPQENGMDTAFLHHHAELNNKTWIGYLSTTGVYGDYDGAWVDETSPLRATEPRSLRRIEAEKHWLECDAHIFRLAGIYGPERNALEQVRQGRAQRIYKQGQYFSRIHVDDIVQVLIASMHAPQPREIYNLCDDAPAPSHAVTAYTCALLGQPLPPLIAFEQAGLSPMGKSFYAANRRVKNDKIKFDLGVTLLHRNYRSGLASILHREQGV